MITTIPAWLIFNSWNLQRIDNTDRSALEKRLGTTFPLIAGVGRDQASASWRTVGGKATPAARKARLAAGRGAERRRKRLHLAQPRSRSASRDRREASSLLSPTESARINVANKLFDVRNARSTIHKHL
jgi:hypothetical protein